MTGRVAESPEVPGRVHDAVTEVVPFDEIMNQIDSGEFKAGVIIHEGQVTYEEEGYFPVVDLGKWWAESQDGLPLPLGGNAIRRDLEHGRAFILNNANRLLYGRDSAGNELQEFLATLDLPEDALEKIRWENAKRLVG